MGVNCKNVPGDFMHFQDQNTFLRPHPGIWIYFDLTTFLSGFKNFPVHTMHIQIKLTCPYASDGIQIHSRETRLTRCAAILVYCSVRDWTNFVPRAHMSFGQHKVSINRHVGSGNETGKSSVKENRTQLHLSFVQGLFIHKCNGCLYYLQQDILILGITLLTLLQLAAWLGQNGSVTINGLMQNIPD